MGLKNKKILITGGAGFIGSNLIDFLIKDNNLITVIDNLKLGRFEFIEKYKTNGNFRFFREDLLNLSKIKPLFKNIDIVIHLAANSDISYGAVNTNVDLNIGTIATYNVLEAMKINQVKELIFSSTSAIYGEATIRPTPENYGPLAPISFYGASKLACEGLVSAFSHNYGFKSWIFRFANIVGRNGTHGVIYDFIRKLRKNSHKLEILGDGKQAKPYLHVTDCIEGMMFGYHKSKNPVNIFNLTCSGNTSVDFIADNLIKILGLRDTKKEYTGTRIGWTGDVPEVKLDPAKMESLGWISKMSSGDAVIKGIKELIKQI